MLLLKCCFLHPPETVGLLGTGAQDCNLDFCAVPELCPKDRGSLQQIPPLLMGWGGCFVGGLLLLFLTWKFCMTGSMCWIFWENMWPWDLINSRYSRQTKNLFKGLFFFMFSCSVKYMLWIIYIVLLKLTLLPQMPTSVKKIVILIDRHPAWRKSVSHFKIDIGQFYDSFLNFNQKCIDYVIQMGSLNRDWPAKSLLT